MYPPQSCDCAAIHGRILHPDFLSEVVVCETTQLLISQDFEGVDSAAILVESQSFGKEVHPATDELEEWIDVHVR
jgi:hypothetical protein